MLLVNLGSPDSPSVKDVRRYLNQFLMDGRVLDAPWLIRRLIVSLAILPFRPKQSAEAYESIWWDEGSPLVVISRRVQAALQERIANPMELAMTYGSPSIPHAVKALGANPEIQTINLLPLFPHYAMSTFETIVVAVQDAMKRFAPGKHLRVIKPFYDNEAYINALVDNTREYLQRDYDHLLFSYHGLPERHLRKTDPTGNHCLKSADCCQVDSPAHRTCYRAQVFRTTETFVRAAGIPDNQYSVTFQSRLGRDPWLQPFTDKTLEVLPERGVKKLLVMCPAFVSDCLETLEEIGIRGRETFMDAGGEEFELIPCLNEHPTWIETLAGWWDDPSMWHADAGEVLPKV
ncbi:MAG: ferrochelatase [candidate division Zixibacteria bacterium]|nr:ferrochelatase [candidate division Zixibacteria bacterium]